MDVANTYDELADHYHLIFENWEFSIARQAAVLSSVLHQHCGLGPSARILDCACGIGTQSLGLAHLGFRVDGCDLSRRAIERARLEASRRNLAIQFSVADMLDLSGLGNRHFDAVICMDNSLPHLESETDLLRAAEQMRSRLRSGGSLIASIRDYDELIKEKPVVQTPGLYMDQGRRRIVFQVWEWLDGRRYVFHLYITREHGDGWQTFHTAGLYRAILRDELAAILRQVGFKKLRWLDSAESNYYQPLILAESA